MAFRICSFSGGGVRGIIPATIISEMLKITKTLGGKGDIRDLCDYVVGTSIGGIIAAGLVASEDGQNPKFTTEEAIGLLKENAAKVFPPDANFLQQLVITLFAEASTFFIINRYTPNSISKYASLIGTFAAGITNKFAGIFDGFLFPKYSREGIDSLLEEKFGELKLTNAILPFATFSFSLEENNPRVWSSFRAYASEQNDYYFKDSLGATSAAPTFFPHKMTNLTTEYDERIYYDIDGGVFANSPANIALSVLRRYADESIIEKLRNSEIKILSIGTGSYKPSASFVPPCSMKEGVFGYGLYDPLILKLMDVVEKNSILQAKFDHKAIRIDPEINSVELMDMDNFRTVNDLYELAVNNYRVNKETYGKYVECFFKNESPLCEELITVGNEDYS